MIEIKNVIRVVFKSFDIPVLCKSVIFIHADANYRTNLP